MDLLGAMAEGTKVAIADQLLGKSEPPFDLSVNILQVPLYTIVPK